MNVNSFLGDSHDGQVDFHLGPIFTLRRAMLFAAKASKKRLETIYIHTYIFMQY